MNTYFIREENMERLDKKLKTLEKKCKSNQFSFYYNKVGEKVEEYTSKIDGSKHYVKYIEVKVDGQVKFNNWEFAATIEHKEVGNVIRSANHELKIPEKYKTCDPTCEHCNKIRSRKDTYLVHNTETGEFKQVGRSCLQEFTNGLNAEDVALLVAMYEKMEEGYYYGGENAVRYYSAYDILRYAFECYRCFGYQKTDSDRSTRDRVEWYMTVDRVCSFYRVAKQDLIDKFQAEMDEVGFNPNTEEINDTVTKALEWIRSCKDDPSDYIHNLYVTLSDDYITGRGIGLTVSLPVAYNNYLKKEEDRQEKEKVIAAEKEASSHVGNVGDRLTIACKSVELVSSWDSMYGPTWMYKIKDADGNIFIWYSSRYIDDIDAVGTIVGTVKQHSEFKGVQQTVLTRCKVA